MKLKFDDFPTAKATTPIEPDNKAMVGTMVEGPLGAPEGESSFESAVRARIMDPMWALHIPR